MAYEGQWYDSKWLTITMADFDNLVGNTMTVGLVARNRPSHVAACLANLAAGRTTSMLSSALSSAALGHEIRKLRPSVVLAETDDWNELTLAAARETGICAIASYESYRGVSYSILAGAPSSEEIDHRRVQYALELLSSGTTGPPKRIGLSWSTVEQAVVNATSAYAGSDANSPQVMVHPLGNVSGLAYAVPPLVAGKPLVLLDRFTVAGWAEAVRDYRPARGTVPPAGIAMLLEANVPVKWLSSLLLVAVGGGRLDPDIQQQFEARYGVPVLTAYGATEFGGVIANWSLDDYRARGAVKRGSAGLASRGVELRIVSPDGVVLQPGETGLLEAKVLRIGPEWIRTSDLARIDVEGYLFIEGRADGAINRGGFKIVPEMLVQILRAHPAIRDAAVVAIADKRLGEVPAAAVETISGMAADPDEILQWLRERLPSYQIPVRILVCEALPRTATFKVALAEVKAMLDMLIR